MTSLAACFVRCLPCRTTVVLMIVRGKMICLPTMTQPTRPTAAWLTTTPRPAKGASSSAALPVGSVRQGDDNRLAGRPGDSPADRNQASRLVCPTGEGAQAGTVERGGTDPRSAPERPADQMAGIPFAALTAAYVRPAAAMPSTRRSGPVAPAMAAKLTAAAIRQANGRPERQSRCHGCAPVLISGSVESGGAPVRCPVPTQTCDGTSHRPDILDQRHGIPCPECVELSSTRCRTSELPTQPEFSRDDHALDL
jgi:hypothetical protein